MAQPVDHTTPIRTWTVQVSTTGALGAGLDRRRCEHDQRAGRVAALTLLVLLDAPDAVTDVIELVRQVAPATPTNAILVAPSTGGADRHDSSAILSLVALGAFGDAAPCVEDIVLRIDGVRDPGDLDAAVVESILTTFGRPGLPIVTWMPGWLPSAEHPAVIAAERILVDSHVLNAAASPGDRAGILPALLALDNSRTVVDLAWVRLEPWRQLAAGRLLSETRLRAVMGRDRAQVTVDVTSEPVTATLLAGWLAGGLASPPDHTPVTVRARSGGRTRVDVQAEHGAVRARLIVEEVDAETVRITTVTEERQRTAEHHALHRLDRTPPAYTLHRALNVSLDDRSWARAAATGLRLANP